MKQMMHRHHIIPRHAGGCDNPSNLVLLTVEDHAEEHRKLFEKYGRIQDKLAWQGLAGQIGKDEIIRQLSNARWQDPKQNEIMSDRVVGLWNSGKYDDKVQGMVGEGNCNYVGASIGTHKVTGETIRLVGGKATKEAGFSQGNISECISGKRKSHKGYTWHREAA